MGFVQVNLQDIMGSRFVMRGVLRSIVGPKIFIVSFALSFGFIAALFFGSTLIFVSFIYIYIDKTLKYLAVTLFSYRAEFDFHKLPCISRVGCSRIHFQYYL